MVGHCDLRRAGGLNCSKFGLKVEQRGSFRSLIGMPEGQVKKEVRVKDVAKYRIRSLFLNILIDILKYYFQRLYILPSKCARQCRWYRRVMSLSGSNFKGCLSVCHWVEMLMLQW